MICKETSFKWRIKTRSFLDNIISSRNKEFEDWESDMVVGIWKLCNSSWETVKKLHYCYVERWLLTIGSGATHKTKVRSVRHCMHCCEVVYKDILKRKTIINSIEERRKVFCFIGAYWAPQKLLLLCWHWFLGGSSRIVTSILAHQGGQYFDYGLLPMNSPWIMQIAQPKIVDTPLMLNSRT